jgi:hypothetical protein
MTSSWEAVSERLEEDRATDNRWLGMTSSRETAIRRLEEDRTTDNRCLGMTSCALFSTWFYPTIVSFFISHILEKKKNATNVVNQVFMYYFIDVMPEIYCW